MNSFRTSELSDLLSNRFRLENSHSPSYLAECLQRMSPSLNRMSLSSITEELAKANGRAFNSSRLPIRGETLNLSFFFELWKRNFRFEGSIYDKFVFTDELKLAFKINPRDFWDVLIRADRELGAILKDSYIAYNLRELPAEVSLNRTAGRNGDDKEILEAVKKSVGRLSVISTPEIEAACLKLFPNLKQVFSGGNFIEKFCAENSIRKLSREPFFIIPVSRLEKITWKFLRDRLNEYSRIKEQGKSLSSVGTLTKAETTFRGDYRGSNDPIEPAPEHLPYQNIMNPSENAFRLIKKSEAFIPYIYDDKDGSWPRKRVTRKNMHLAKGILTIGYGFTLRTFPELEKYFDNEMKQEDADSFLTKIVNNKYTASVIKVGKGKLNQNQFDALTSISFNKGENFLTGFSKAAIRLRDYIENGNIKAAANLIRADLDKESQLSNSPGLKKRRAEEAELYEKIN